jgi:hypothetical protein
VTPVMGDGEEKEDQFYRAIPVTPAMENARKE